MGAGGILPIGGSRRSRTSRPIRNLIYSPCMEAVKSTCERLVERLYTRARWMNELLSSKKITALQFTEVNTTLNCLDTALSVVGGGDQEFRYDINGYNSEASIDVVQSAMYNFIYDLADSKKHMTWDAVKRFPLIKAVSCDQFRFDVKAPLTYNYIVTQGAMNTVDRAVRKGYFFNADGLAHNSLTLAPIPRKFTKVINGQPYDVRSLQGWLKTNSPTVPHSRRRLTGDELAQLKRFGSQPANQLTTGMINLSM